MPKDHDVLQTPGARTPPKVQDSIDTATYHQKQRLPSKEKQRYPIGTRVRVVKKKTGDRKETLIGKITEYDLATGLYHVEFKDGEWEEFDDDKMEYFFLLVKT